MAVALLPIAAATTNLDALDGWGLGRVLSPAGWAAIVCAVAACVAELKSPRPRIPMLGTATGVLILCTTGMPSIVEPVARFATAWLIAGFTDAIAITGHTPPGVDARFYWPAFFAQWAFFRDAGGATQLDRSCAGTRPPSSRCGRSASTRWPARCSAAPARPGRRRGCSSA